MFEEEKEESDSSHSTKTATSGKFLRCWIDIFSGTSRNPALTTFFTELPQDLGANEPKDPQIKAKIKTKSEKKLTKIEEGVKSKLEKHAQMATEYFFGVYNLPLEQFKQPKSKYANRDFDYEHATKLTEEWCAAGILFPEKAAVVCAFEVRSF